MLVYMDRNRGQGALPVPTALWAKGPQPASARPVLIVDDDRDICAILQDVVEGEGYRVTVAHNGVEALRALDRERPALILLDLMMPVMNGWELAAHLYADARWCDIPVVVISAELRLARNRLTAQVVAALAKPFDIGQVAALVQQHAA